jgi:hypothetical protein
LDHFHPPLAPARHWEGFHALWLATMVEKLNGELLPERYFAEPQIHIGGRVEVDVATFDAESLAAPGDGATATLAAPVWSPPATALEMPAVFPDDIEVQVFLDSGGATLVAAIELVSPGNKDRPETRRAFAAKCASYLQQGIGLIVVDTVTDRHANLHDELVDLLRQPDPFRFPGAPALYAAAYRPKRQATGDRIDLWLTPLAVGKALPLLPLALRGGPCLPIDFEATYTEARHRSRLG